MNRIWKIYTDYFELLAVCCLLYFNVCFGCLPLIANFVEYLIVVSGTRDFKVKYKVPICNRKITFISHAWGFGLNRIIKIWFELLNLLKLGTRKFKFDGLMYQSFSADRILGLVVSLTPRSSNWIKCTGTNSLLLTKSNSSESVEWLNRVIFTDTSMSRR